MPEIKLWSEDFAARIRSDKKFTDIMYKHDAQHTVATKCFAPNT